MGDTSTLTATAAISVPAETPGTAKPTPADVSAFLDQPQFHRSLVLPATDQHGELTISYAVSGAHSDEDAPVLLFIAGMMGGRYLALFGDHLCAQLGLRMVSVDRPGMGFSTRVPPEQRLAVWLEMVPLLLQALHVEHVSLLAHSCGVIYALNTLYAMPHILPPDHRTLYLFSPWVPPPHSGVRLFSAAALLPAPLIANFDHVVGFVRKVVVPPLRFSIGAVSSASSALVPANRPDADRPKGAREDVCQQCYGMSLAAWALYNDAIVRRIFAEDTSGASGEALLSLRKPCAGSWGVADDYAACPALLDARCAPLAIHVAWAASDMMIGKGGEAYFDQCFQAHKDQPPDGSRRLAYTSETVSETDHENLCLPQFGAMSAIVDEIAKKVCKARTRAENEG